jgi:hypothetical protein
MKAPIASRSLAEILELGSSVEPLPGQLALPIPRLGVRDVPKRKRAKRRTTKKKGRAGR